MVEISSGEKGKGKTKYLLDKVNTDIKKVDGSIVYIDKNTKHMYELDSKIRLINMGDYPIDSTDEFLGFLNKSCLPDFNMLYSRELLNEHLMKYYHH